jgi:trafficking protein particle complex subunit 11
MSGEIALREKSTSERGIKLTSVLMASRKMLGSSKRFRLTLSASADDHALDTRLTFIRRQSGLDYRAALFVLSPMSPSKLSEFIKRSFQLLFLSFD